MNIRKKIAIASLCSRAILFNEKFPIFVGWCITNRCNMRCAYCASREKRSRELSTQQAFRIIDDLAMSGVLVMRLTGGEPLVREDIGDIVDHAVERGMAVTLGTNGLLFPEKMKQLKVLNGVNISLEGREETHDAIRGKGAYRAAREAMKAAHNCFLPISLTTTLTSFNSDKDNINHLLDIAKEFGCKVFFQPAVDYLLFDDKPNPISPGIAEYQTVIAYLMHSKRHNRHIGNSQSGLRHLLHWPELTHIDCAAGKIMCRIDAEGKLFSCSRCSPADQGLNLLEHSFKQLFSNLGSPRCGNCWCASLVEFNLLMRLRCDTVINSLWI